MNKVLAAGLGVLLAAGSAGPLQAASHIDFSGYYRTYLMSETNLGRQADPESFTDSYFGHRLEISLDFRPTDEISVHWRLRAPDFRRWGTGDTDFQTRHIYGQITQNWGQVLVGRLDEDFDNYGLASLGWIPENNPIFTTVSPFDNGDPVDGIRYANTWDNGFSLTAQYTKLSNNSDDDGNIINARHDDQDHDRFIVEGAYQWDGGGVSLGLWYDRDATNGARAVWQDQGGAYDAAFYINPAVRHGWHNGFSINFEALLGWGSSDRGWRNDFRLNNVVDLDTEGYGAYLDFDYNYGPGNVNLAAWYVSGTKLDEGFDNDNPKSKSLVSLGGNFIPLLVAYNDGAAGWGRVGGDIDSNSNSNAISLANNATLNFINPAFDRVRTFDYTQGGGFLNKTGDLSADYWATTGLDIVRPTVNNTDGAGANDYGVSLLNSAPRAQSNPFNQGTEANHWGVGLSGNHAFTDDIAMHYAVAYLALNEPNYRALDRAVWNTAGATSGTYTGQRYIEQDKDLGFEVDLGFSFQLLDNLKFTTAFGYMFNGDAFKTLRGYTIGDVNAATEQAQVNAVWDDPDDTYSWMNTLTFSF